MSSARAVAQPPPQAAPARSARMTLASVTRGVVHKPLRVLLYGSDGVGKTTFAAGMPTPIFLGPEDGTSTIDVARFPVPRDWLDVKDAVAELTNEPHEYGTLAIDTLDWLEPLLWEHVCRTAGVKSIEAVGGGYGKGYVAALDEWRSLLASLDRLRDQRGMHVILLAHAWIRTFKNPDPDQGDYDRYELKLHAKASGLLKEWSDAVLFANYETLTTTKGGRTRGISSGARLVYTERRAQWDAKNRYGLPETLPLSWDDLEAAMSKGEVRSVEALSAECARLLELVDADTRAKASAWLSRNGNATSAPGLAQLADRLRAKVEVTERENPQQPANAGEEAA